jgi:hypothetical protein
LTPISGLRESSVIAYPSPQSVPTDTNTTVVNYTSNGSNDPDYVYGGYAIDGTTTVTGNSLTVIKGKVTTGAYGGYTDVSSNDVFKNHVIIEDTTGISYLFGGRTEGSGTVTYNTITIKNGMVSRVTGGVSGTAISDHNTVKVLDGTVNSWVYGGSSGSGAVTSNSVTIKDGTVNGDIYGGKKDSGDGDLTNNAVTIQNVVIDVGNHAIDFIYDIDTSGDIAGEGSITKTGGGTLTFSGFSLSPLVGESGRQADRGGGGSGFGNACAS